MNGVRPLSGDEIRRLMRENGLTIRSIAKAHDITMKRVREVRETGVQGFLADEWHFMLTGAWQSDVASGKVVAVPAEFIESHMARMDHYPDMPAPKVLGRARGSVLLSADDPGLALLRDDAAEYAKVETDCPKSIRDAARRTLAALDRGLPAAA